MGMSMRDMTADQFGKILTHLIISEPGLAERLSPTVIPAIASELLLDVAERAQRSGGEGSLIVLRVEIDDDGKDRARAIIGKIATRFSADDGDYHVPFDRRCKLGDVLAVMGEGASITLRFSDDELELQDFGDAPEVRLTGGTPALVR